MAEKGREKLSERTHYCPSCGLEAHRDMVSAALVRELGLADEQFWDKGLASASRTKHAAVEAILSSCRTPLSDEEEAGNLGGDPFSSSKQSTADSLATALLCEKQTSDPEGKSHSISHVPTCEKPAVQRLEAPRKAAVKEITPEADTRFERLL